jgi:two-component system, OmpR family, response regulator CpxR
MVRNHVGRAIASNRAGLEIDRVLLVDDDEELCEILTEYFSAEGFAVESAHDGVRGLARARSGDHAIVILDLLLPRMRGLEMLHQLREGSNLPVLILTARGEEVDRILGLELGADDYLAKPFNPRELAARVRAILRRASGNRVAGRLDIGDLTLDPMSRQVWRSGHSISLTMAEFVLLETLARHTGQVVSRERLAEHVLGRRLASFDRSIDVHVSNLRKKLGDVSGAREHIRAVRGEGYVFVRIDKADETDA